MLINVITIFPDFFTSPLQSSLLGKAIENDILNVNLVSLREYGLGNYHKLDDTPYGGGNGMVLMVEPIDKALKDIRRTSPESHTVLITPRGKRYDQQKARSLSKLSQITLICGHYEGIDERVAENLVDESLSVGDYILSGGEPGALLMIDSIARLLPGFMGNESSTEDESFEKENYIEYPQYTRPAEYSGWNVPDVLLSGNHQKIEEWRKEQAEKSWKKFR